MKRTAMLLVVMGTVWALPSFAWAAGAGSVSVEDISSAATLIATMFLLATAIGLERVARGSAIADNISYVVAACICLGASALGRWVARILPAGVTVEQIALSADALSLVGITLLSVYFLRVRAALRRFLDLAGTDEAELARAQAGEMFDTPEAEAAGAGTADG